MVIFSHGFAVQRDAHGLFTDISQQLSKGFGYVLFDYNDISRDGSTVKVTMLKAQAERLKVVVEWTRQQPGVNMLHLLAHSMGCTVVAELAPDAIGQMLMLAPPLAYSRSLTEHLIHKPDAYKDERAIWHIPRSDGTTSLIGAEIFQQWERVDYEGELVKLALLHPFVLVIPESDSVLPDMDYTELMVMPAITSVGIEGADHDFTGAVRRELVAAINKELSATLKL